MRRASVPLEGAVDLDLLIERIGDARFVLLGEASHGTAEFYTLRATISRRLVVEKGFDFIAVEGDWPDSYRVNRYVKGYADSGPDAETVLHEFRRWPTWMWANREVVALAEWLRAHNAGRPEGERVGFYGLDVYSLWESMEAVIGYLEAGHGDAEAIEAAWEAFRCFEPYGEDAQRYAWTTTMVPTSCEGEVVALLGELRERPDAFAGDDEASFSAEQNALVAVNAERYYRAMVRSDASSWNLRDRHMVETLERLVRFHGPGARAIVWEHNTHIGDARATDMARAGMVNVGQLVREAHGADGVVLVGFGTHRGSVIAAEAWGAPMARVPVPAARAGSWEDILHRAGPGDRLLMLEALRQDLGCLQARGHRAIGVVYRPDEEARGNYVPTVLPLRYDAFVFVDETHALHPLHVEPAPEEQPPETYPWGV